MQDASNLSQDGPEDSAPLVEPRRPGNNLPLQLTSFVGRGRETEQVRGLLEENRLLTLSGPGGSGKTRLALAIASEVAQDFEDGAWLVELASLSDPDLVPQAVASVLGVRGLPGGTLLDSLCLHLGPWEVLLVLDNCEHLIGACAHLAQTLLLSCPRLSILATSRETLGVRGERNFPVPSLSSPGTHNLGVGEIEGYESVRLFVERARYRVPDFAQHGCGWRQKPCGRRSASRSSSGTMQLRTTRPSWQTRARNWAKPDGRERRTKPGT